MSTGNVPAEVIAQGFRLIDPMSAVTEYVDLWQHMWNDDYLNSYRTVMAWAKDQIPFPGTTFVQMQNELVRPNVLPTGRVPLHGGEVDFADIRVPFNNIIGEKDTIVPPASTTPLTPIVGAGDGTETRLRGGHVGLVVGRTARAPPHPGDGVVDRVARRRRHESTDRDRCLSRRPTRDASTRSSTRWPSSTARSSTPTCWRPDVLNAWMHPRRDEPRPSLRSRRPATTSSATSPCCRRTTSAPTWRRSASSTIRPTAAGDHLRPGPPRRRHCRP